MKSGTGTVEYVAARDGTVYVLNRDSNRLIAVGGVRKGQTVRVDAATDQVTINGKVINQRPMSNAHAYQILLKDDEERNDR